LDLHGNHDLSTKGGLQAIGGKGTTSFGGSGGADYTDPWGHQHHVGGVDVNVNHNMHAGVGPTHTKLQLVNLNNLVGAAHTGDGDIKISGPMGGHLDLHATHDLSTKGGLHGIGGKATTGLIGSGSADYTDPSGHTHHLAGIDMNVNHNMHAGVGPEHTKLQLVNLNLVGAGHTGDGDIKISGPFGGHLDLHGNHDLSTKGGLHGIGGKGTTGFGGSGSADYTGPLGVKHHIGGIDMNVNHNFHAGIGPKHTKLQLVNLNLVGAGHAGDEDIKISGPMGGHLDLHATHDLSTKGGLHGIGAKATTGLTGSGSADYTDPSGHTHHLGGIDMNVNHNMHAGIGPMHTKLQELYFVPETNEILLI